MLSEPGVEPVSQSHISNLASDKLPSQVFSGSLSPRSRSDGCQCLSLRGGGRARERVQCRNQLLAQMFMGRWSCILQAKTPPKYHTLCLSSGIYLSPSCSFTRADFDNQNVWVCRVSSGLYIFPSMKYYSPSWNIKNITSLPGIV